VCARTCWVANNTQRECCRGRERIHVLCISTGVKIRESNQFLGLALEAADLEIERVNGGY
jgi:hypothetical protein